jgi:methylated-DNA-[protein]-cysteine S-methyltransferase
MTKNTAIFDSPVGHLLARVDAGKLIELSFVRTSVGEAPSEPASGVLRDAIEQLGEYFKGRRKAFDLPLELRGPEFHRRVWTALCDIPYGQTISYGQLAKNVGDPDAARAVGSANGANPIAIIVPCHRVIGSDGSLIGYGGGLRRKQTLLDLESGRLSLALM